MKRESVESFSLDEVFEIAEQLERNGASYYKTAAAMFKKAGVAKVFTRLAGQELDHEKVFAGLRQKLVSPGQAVASYDVDDTVAGYLRMIAGRYVFPNGRAPKDELKGNESPGDVVEMAIERERDSVVFYIGIMDAMKGPRDRAVVNRIIREEQSHLIDLSNLLAEMK